MHDDVPSMSGTLVQGLVEVAREVVGASAVATGLEEAPAWARDRVLGALPGQWVPIEASELAFGSIARVAGRDLPELHLELARLSVARAVKTFWRVLLHFTTDQALVSRCPVFFGKSYNRGRLSAHVSAPGRGQVDLVDWPDAPDWPLRGSRAGIETVMTAAGRRDVRVQAKRTHEGAVFLITWS